MKLDDGKEYEKQAPPRFAFINADGNFALDEAGRVWERRDWWPHVDEVANFEPVHAWKRVEAPALVEVK